MSTNVRNFPFNVKEKIRYKKILEDMERLRSGLRPKHFKRDGLGPVRMLAKPADGETAKFKVYTLTPGSQLDVDWGDGNSETLTLSSAETVVSHTYATGGEYWIKFPNYNQYDTFNGLVFDQFSCRIDVDLMWLHAGTEFRKIKVFFKPEIYMYGHSFFLPRKLEEFTYQGFWAADNPDVVVDIGTLPRTLTTFTLTGDNEGQYSSSLYYPWDAEDIVRRRNVLRDYRKTFKEKYARANAVLVGSFEELPPNLQMFMVSSVRGVVWGELKDLPSSVVDLTVLAAPGMRVVGKLSDAPQLQKLILVEVRCNVDVDLSDFPSTASELNIQMPIDFFDDVYNPNSARVRGSIASIKSSSFTKFTLHYVDASDLVFDLTAAANKFGTMYRVIELVETGATVTGDPANLLGDPGIGTTYFALGRAEKVSNISIDLTNITNLFSFSVWNDGVEITGSFSGITPYEWGFQPFSVNGVSSQISEDLFKLPRGTYVVFSNVTGTKPVFTPGVTTVPSGYEATVYSIRGTFTTQQEVDDFLQVIYENRANFSRGTIYGVDFGKIILDIRDNPVPSGTYQDSPTPSTGLEFVYKLMNDPDNEGFDTWDIYWDSRNQYI